MIEILVLLSVLSFISTYVFLKSWIKGAKEKGFVGIDVHKVNKPKVAEAGGVIVLLVFSLSLSKIKRQYLDLSRWAIAAPIFPTPMMPILFLNFLNIANLQILPYPVSPY